MTKTYSSIEELSLSLCLCVSLPLCLSLSLSRDHYQCGGQRPLQRHPLLLQDGCLHQDGRGALLPPEGRTHSPT